MSECQALKDFFAAWGKTDAAARRSAIAGAMADQFAYSDPRSGSRITTLDGLADYVGQFSANAPGWTAEVEKTDVQNGFVRALVRFGGKGPDGKDMAQHGTYFADLAAGGRIATLSGFVGREPG